MSKWLDEVGYQIELTGEQKNLWSELNKQGNVTVPITVSGYNMAQSLIQNSEKIATYIDESHIDQSIYTASAIGESIAGTAISGATLSYPPDKLPQAYYQLDKVVSQRTNHVDISQKLRSIDPSLADEYDNAWLGLHATSKDETRSPMLLIREVVNRLYHHYAPDYKVKAHFNLSKDEKIERRHRVDYIATLIDAWRKPAFLREKQALLDIYGELSNKLSHDELTSRVAERFAEVDLAEHAIRELGLSRTGDKLEKLAEGAGKKCDFKFSGSPSYYFESKYTKSLAISYLTSVVQNALEQIKYSIDGAGIGCVWIFTYAQPDDLSRFQGDVMTIKSKFSSIGFPFKLNVQIYGLGLYGDATII